LNVPRLDPKKRGKLPPPNSTRRGGGGKGGGERSLFPPPHDLQGGKKKGSFPQKTLKKREKGRGDPFLLLGTWPPAGGGLKTSRLFVFCGGKEKGKAGKKKKPSHFSTGVKEKKRKGGKGPSVSGLTSRRKKKKRKKKEGGIFHRPLLEEKKKKRLKRGS